MTTTSDDIRQLVSAGFGAVDVNVVRPGKVFQIDVPVFHRDGDALQLYVRPASEGQVIVSDMGSTSMRLSYDGEVDSANLERLADAHGLKWNEGALETTVAPNEIVAALLGLAQVESVAEASQRRAREVRRETAEAFRAAVLDVIKSKFGDSVDVGWHEAEDEQGTYSVDALVKTPKPLAIMAISSNLVAERAIGTRLHLANRIPGKPPIWVAIPKALPKLSNITQRRIGQHFQLPLTSFEDAPLLPAKLDELAR